MAYTDDGELLHRKSVPLAGRQGAAVGALIAEHLSQLSAECDCEAAGICVPGLYRADRGSVWAPNIPGWDDYPLLDELRSALGPTHRVTIDSDRAACILGETWRGAARGSHDAIFLAVGTGIGASIHLEAKRWAQPLAIEQVRFVRSALGSDAGLYGAGRLAMSQNAPT